jgi:hypothetical protein
MRGGEKRGIRRDAARHCQTGVSNLLSSRFARALLVDNHGENRVEKSVVQHNIESGGPGPLTSTACKCTLP